MHKVQIMKELVHQETTSEFEVTVICMKGKIIEEELVDIILWPLH